MKPVGKYLLADNLRAAIIALGCALFAFFFPTGFIAAAILGLVTLQNGYRSGLQILAFLLLPGLAFWVTHHINLFYRFDFLLAEYVLVFIFALILRHWSSWQRVLEFAAGFSALVIVSLHLFIPQIKHMWVSLINNYLKINDWASMIHLSSGEDGANFVNHLAPIASGGFAFFILFGMIILLMLARWWQCSIFSPGQLQREFMAIRISPLAASLLLVASLGLFFKPDWLIDIYPVLLLPFTIGGLSILHRLIITRRKEMIFLLMAVYLALLLITFFTVIALATIGFIDSFYNFRKRHHALLENRSC